MEEAANQPLSVPTPSLKERILRYKLFIGIGLGVILLIALAVFLIRQIPTLTKPAASPTPQAATTKLPTLSSDITNLIFGVLTKDSATIKSYDFKTNQTTILATLPANVKKIMPLQDGRLLFINLTNSGDQGQEIAVYNPTDKKTATILKAETGFGIDDFVLSTNQQYLATWEVKLNSETKTLAGGESQVYSFSLLNPTEGKHLIYDENQNSNSNKTFHYPSAINDSGEVFSDSFLPNSGAGWAYGMSVSDFKGTTKTELISMKNGTYGTKPVLSPDGGFLAFAGYNGAKGDGTIVQNGFRQALVSPNTLEILDLSTKSRRVLANLSSDNIYSEVAWDRGGNNLIYTTFGKTSEISGQYLYNFPTNSGQKILALGGEKHLLATLTDNLVLVATAEKSTTTVANLGESYAPSYKSVALLDLTSQAETSLNIDDPLIQLVAMKVTTKSDSVLGVTNQLAQAGRQLQLKDLKLAPKPSLEPTRSCQLTNSCITSPQPSTVASARPAASSPIVSCSPLVTCPVGERCDNSLGRPFCVPENNDTPYCIDLFGTMCLQNLPPGYPSNILALCKADRFGESCRAAIEPLGIGVFDNFVNCVNWGVSLNHCLLSPLYLYGPAGQIVQVQINTPISNSNLDDSGNFKLALTGDGRFKFNDQIYSSVDFDYTPNLRKINPPRGGEIVAIDNLSPTLRNFANKLGLNNLETEDLVKSATKQINSPYVLVSFFDQETSEKILPITFNPKPDTYQNIVFYLKPLMSLPDYQIVPPSFPAITPKGQFSAVEISTLVDN